ncbi:hypothetical protein XcodCFBP4690_02605 [Xanthomonas codiaei]|uniref:Uncharacterized protein n=1 Tax=Xanthomonas codiaei TaxID=56463 RepID=A0A2S7CWH5_9XANT|nr:hypothetical protein XcodCFBP4690_02605 [Xanthomonas codiaei]
MSKAASHAGRTPDRLGIAPRLGPARQRVARDCRLFYQATDQRPGAVSSPLAGPLAAWMPPPSLHGRIHGVSRTW